MPGLATNAGAAIKLSPVAATEMTLGAFDGSLTAYLHMATHMIAVNLLVFRILGDCHSTALPESSCTWGSRAI